MNQPNPLLVTLLLAAIVLVALNLAGQIHFPGRFHPAMPGAGPGLAGPARIVDGDTLDIAGTRIRLFGIDAPESAQACERNGTSYACGQTAKRYLAELVADRPVACRPVDTDRYGREVATCTAGAGELNAAMVASGWALAYRQYATAYVSQEEQARRAHAGLWAGRFEPPWEWRRQRR